MSVPFQARQVGWRIAVALPLGLGLWWALQELALRGLFLPLADALWPDLLGLDSGAWVDGTAQGWRVYTRYRLASSTEAAVYVIGPALLARLVAGCGLLLALVIATPQFNGRRSLLAFASQMLVAFMGVSAFAWHGLVAMCGTTPSFVDPSFAPFPEPLLVPAAPDWVFAVSGYAAYLSLVVLPWAAPLFVWGIINRDRLAGALGLDGLRIPVRADK